MKSLVTVALVIVATSLAGCSSETTDDNAAIDNESSNNEVNQGHPPGGAQPGRAGIPGPFGPGSSAIDIEDQVAFVSMRLKAQEPSLKIFAPSILPGGKGENGGMQKIFVLGKTDTYQGREAPAVPTYTLTFALVPECNGANACSMGSVTSYPSPAPFEPNGEVDGVKVHFDPGACGASCAPPSMSWQGPTTRITLSYKGATRETLETLVRSALKAGPR